MDVEYEKLLEEVHHTKNIREELVRELDSKDAAISRLNKRNKTLHTKELKKKKQIKRLHRSLARRVLGRGKNKNGTTKKVDF
uniref:60S ribosomal protein L35 n=1 Tax=Caenorhabditis tropicalis TaxID=1561998 RepID=A0A1I7TPA8_9PELO